MVVHNVFAFTAVRFRSKTSLPTRASSSMAFMASAEVVLLCQAYGFYSRIGKLGFDLGLGTQLNLERKRGANFRKGPFPYPADRP
jgi:hypothetical protein